ncbi:MAG: helix-turn-helix domain-containing protein [Prevotella sp.]|jgi:transcriptional regulator with XRE-family HTH domain|nr:helix-turn-helix domain-containing protein [Prevotella sp.]
MEEKKESGVCTHHGKNVGFWRTFNKWTQLQLGEMVGLSQNTISDLEQQKEINENTLHKLSTALGVHINSLKECDHQATLDTCRHIVNYINNNYIQPGSIVTNLINTDKNNINNPLDKVSELYERIAELSVENALLKEEIKKTKG